MPPRRRTVFGFWLTVEGSNAPEFRFKKNHPRRSGEAAARNAFTAVAQCTLNLYGTPRTTRYLRCSRKQPRRVLRGVVRAAGRRGNREARAGSLVSARVRRTCGDCRGPFPHLAEEREAHGSGTGRQTARKRPCRACP